MYFHQGIFFAQLLSPVEKKPGRPLSIAMLQCPGIRVQLSLIIFQPIGSIAIARPPASLEIEDFQPAMSLHKKVNSTCQNVSLHLRRDVNFGSYCGLYLFPILQKVIHDMAEG